MNVLVFDTSSDTMFVNLSKEDSITDSKVVKTTKQQYNSAFLVSTTSEILEKNNLKMQNIDAVGINAGPGSFTGLRASATIARVIAQQLNIPAVGIPSMQIYSKLNTLDKKTICIMDARRGMAFVGIYDKNSKTVLEPCMVEYEKALSRAKQEDYFIVSDTRMGINLEEAGIAYIDFEKSDTDFGKFLMELVKDNLKTKDNTAFSWQKLKPLYIQTPPVSQKK